MTIAHTRRRLLGGMALAVPAAVLPLRRVAALDQVEQLTEFVFRLEGADLAHRLPHLD